MTSVQTHSPSFYRKVWNQKRLSNPRFDLLLILKALFTYPAMIVITGEWKSGKTDLALYFAVDMLLEFGIISKVGSNIQCDDPRVDYVASVEALRYWLHKDNRRKCYVFDEAIKFAYKRTPMAKTQVGLIQVIAELSKGHSRGILIAQDPTMVDKDLLNPIWCKALVIKGGSAHKDSFTISSFPASLIVGGGKRDFYDVPRTTVKFNPYLEAEFDLGGDSPLLADPEVNVFMQWSSGRSATELARDPEVRKMLGREVLRTWDVFRVLHRVSRAMLTVSQPKAVEVLEAMRKESDKP